MQDDFFPWHLNKTNLPRWCLGLTPRDALDWLHLAPAQGPLWPGPTMAESHFGNGDNAGTLGMVPWKKINPHIHLTEYRWVYIYDEIPKVWGYGFLCLLMILCNCCFFPTLYFYIYNMHGWSLDVKIDSLVKRWNSCLKPGAAMDSTLRLLAPLSAETKCPRSSCLLMCLESWMKPSWTWVPNWQLVFGKLLLPPVRWYRKYSSFSNQVLKAF